MVYIELFLFFIINDNIVKLDFFMIFNDIVLYIYRYIKYLFVDEVGISFVRFVDFCIFVQILGVVYYYYLVRMVYCESYVLLILENKVLLFVLIDQIRFRKFVYFYIDWGVQIDLDVFVQIGVYRCVLYFVCFVYFVRVQNVYYRFDFIFLVLFKYFFK